MVLLAGTIGPLYAAGIDNNSNFSTGYIRTFNRNAVTNAPDAAVYNPAGIVKLDNGFYVSVHNQFIIKNYSNETGSNEYAATNPTLLLPSAFLVYTQDVWGVFGTFTIPAGGGSLKYEDGVAALNENPYSPLAAFNPSLEAFNAYYAGALGAAFAPHEMISFAVAGRMMTTQQTVKIETEIPVPPLGDATLLRDSEASATGYGAILGFNFSPMPELNIGAHYEMNTALEWEYEKRDGPLAAALPETYNRDLPALLGAGISYMFTPELRAEVDIMYYFNEQADWDGAEDHHDNGYDLGAALEYDVMPELTISCGYLLSQKGADSTTYNYVNPALDYVMAFAAGACYGVTPCLDLELGVSGVFYDEDIGYTNVGEPDNLEVTLNKTAITVAAGLTYKLY
jgi:long-chain fatty acid transport protein